MIRPLILAFLFLTACGKPASPEIRVSDAWARATAAGQTSAAVYADIDNRGGMEDVLLAVSSDRAAHAMLHEGNVQDGIAKMRMVERIDLPAGQRINLKPGGSHIMLMGVAEPLMAGRRFNLRLKFEKSGEIVVPVTILAPGER